MNTFPKIVSCFLAAILFLSSVAGIQDTSLQRVVLHHSHGDNFSSYFTGTSPDLFAIQPGGQTGADFFQNQNLRESTESQDFYDNRIPETAEAYAVSVVIKISKTIISGLTIRDLIYPFHFFW